MAKDKKEIPLWAKTGHKKPITRRDFLGAGLIPFAAQMMFPNWLSMILANPAHAQDALACASGDPNSLIPFITVNLSGGAAMSSNFLPMNAKGEPIASYNKMGLGNNQVPIEREFGNVPFAGMENGQLLSKFLEGLRAGASRAALDKTAFVGIPCDNQSDTSGNKFDLSGAVTKAGLVGSPFPILGMLDTRNGLNQASALVVPPVPLIVRNFTFLLTSIGYSSSLGSSLNQAQKETLAKFVSNLNTSQSRKLASVQGGESIKKVLDCAGIKNVDIVRQGSGAVDPRSNPQVQSLWGINANSQINNESLIISSMVYNTLLGQAGTSNVDLGGYDYHDNTRTTANRKDRDAGVTVGRIIETAKILGRPVFIYMTSDGSVFSPESDSRQAPFPGDRSSNGMAYFLYFNPAGRPETSGFQMGAFTNAQAADTSYITGGNPEMVAAAVFANWCKANKRMDLFERVAGRPFSQAQLDSLVLKVA